MKNIIKIMLILCICAIGSCDNYEEEPPKVGSIKEYLIPAAEIPTAEENEIAKAIRQEYYSSIE